MNRYFVRNPEIDKFKDNIQTYYYEHKKKFDNFSVCVMWKKNDININKISIPSILKNRKPHLFEPNKIELPIMLKIPAYDFLDQFKKECVNDKVDEINIIIISDLNDITFLHYIDQSNSMLCRKLVRNFIEENFGVFDYNWLPNCYRYIKI